MSAPQYVYPSVQTLEQIEQDLLPVLQPDDPIFGFFPIEEVEDDVLRWEQRDNFRGLQQIRGLNGDMPRVARIGAKGYLMEPGVYGEKQSIDERELTKRRKLGSFTDRIDVTDLMREIQDDLIGREFNRIRQILWTLATTGTFSVSNADGTVAQTDIFPLQTQTSATSWVAKTTATPLADLRQAKLLGRGHSVDFGSKATAYGNQLTVNNLLSNQNPSDLFGRRGPNGSTFNSLVGDNSILLENALPQVVAYDDGYYDDNGVFRLFIPDNTMILFGVRPNNRPIGSYRKTYNANGDRPGSFMTIKDTKGEDVRHITLGRGHNGGPVCWFPSAFVILNV